MTANMWSACDGNGMLSDTAPCPGCHACGSLTRTPDWLLDESAPIPSGLPPWGARFDSGPAPAPVVWNEHEDAGAGVLARPPQLGWPVPYIDTIGPGPRGLPQPMPPYALQPTASSHGPTVQVQSKHYRWYFPRHNWVWWLCIGWWWAPMVWPIQWALRIIRPSTYMPSTYRRSTAKPAFISEKRYRKATR
jgi:hypothetical protein